MHTPELQKQINRLGGIYVETIDDSDNLGIVLCSYFEKHRDRPEEDPTDDELGWGKWALKKTDEALALIAKEMPKPAPSPGEAALLAALQGLLAINEEEPPPITNGYEQAHTDYCLREIAAQDAARAALSAAQANEREGL